MRAALRGALGGSVLLCLATAGACSDGPPGAALPSTAPPSVALPSALLPSAVLPTGGPTSPGTGSPGAGAATAAPGQPAPRLLTVRDDGRSFTTRVGARLSLSLPASYADEGLRVEGAAVDVTEDVSDAPSGQRTWELRPREAGVAVLRAGPFDVELRVAPA